MKYKVPQKRRPVTDRRHATAASFFSPEKFIAATPAHIHTDGKAQLLSAQFNARAFTVGNHIFFNKNEYQPHTAEGQKLLVHELAHVRQARLVVARQPKPDAAAEARLQAAQKAAQEKAQAGLQAQTLFWKDIHEAFPEEGRKLAGTGNDDAVDYLQTSFKEGDEQQGNIMVQHTAPVVYVGLKYAAEADAAKRKTYIQTELDKIDNWRFDTFRIDDKDIKNTTVTGKLTALDLIKKQEYITQLQSHKAIANMAVQEFIRRQMPSTPMQAGATPTAGGGFSFQFDNVTINVLTDVFDASDVKEKSGETRFRPISGNNYPPTPAWKSKGKKVTEITNPPQKIFPVWTVQTFYGKNTDPAGKSGYGYGTRPQDLAPGGNPTLRFHEGSHGEAFINYVQSHIGAVPYPTYTGSTNDTPDELKSKHAAFVAARDAFKAMLDVANKEAETSIDCAGKSIVKYSAEKGIATTVVCP